MDVTKIRIGENPPHDVNVLIEIPQGGAPVKYEMDKESGAMFVNRFLHTAMFYPANYGFIPNTLSEDRDPCDAMVISQIPVASGAVIRARPIGALMMEDEAGIDEKIITVPIDRLSPYYSTIKELTDLPLGTLDVIKHFFEHYKDLEKGKWVKVVRWVRRDQAKRLIVEGIERAAGIVASPRPGAVGERDLKRRSRVRA
jgi:inorganic pyrophosphatase